MPRAKSPGRPFQKGQSGNPLGPRIDPAMKAFRETTYKDFISGLQRFGGQPLSFIEAELERPDITAFEAMFGNIVLSAAKGEKDARAVLLDRLWGKVKDAVEISTRDIDDRMRTIGADKLTALMRQIDFEANKDTRG